MAVAHHNTRAASVLGYRTQMVTTPADIISAEVSGILMALKLAGNSINADCAFKLEAWIGANQIRPSIFCEANMVRAA